MIKLAMNMMIMNVPCLFSRLPTARNRVVENSMPRGCAQKTVETFSCSLLQMSTTRVPATIRVETLSGKPALPWVSFQGSGHRPSSLLRHPVRSTRRGKNLSAVVEVIRPEAEVLGLTQKMTSSSWKFVYSKTLQSRELFRASRESLFMYHRPDGFRDLQAQIGPPLRGDRTRVGKSARDRSERLPSE